MPRAKPAKAGTSKYLRFQITICHLPIVNGGCTGFPSSTLKPGHRAPRREPFPGFVVPSSGGDWAARSTLKRRGAGPQRHSRRRVKGCSPPRAFASVSPVACPLRWRARIPPARLESSKPQTCGHPVKSSAAPLSSGFEDSTERGAGGESGEWSRAFHEVGDSDWSEARLAG
jgi:hypothetical protein